MPPITVMIGADGPVIDLESKTSRVPVSSRGIRDQPRNPPKYTEKRIRINFPFPCPSRGRAHARRVGSFRGYPFVMIFLAVVI